MEIQNLRQKLMAIFAHENVDSAIAAAAMADCLATIAATLDREAGHISIKDRLHDFCGRVEETYKRMRNNGSHRFNLENQNKFLK